MMSITYWDHSKNIHEVNTYSNIQHIGDNLRFTKISLSTTEKRHYTPPQYKPDIVKCKIIGLPTILLVSMFS